ncbi:MAG: histidine kinase, partial [Pseudonocardia sp.]
MGWASALFWRVFLLNALVFAVGVALLVVSPATVSAPASVRELAVLGLGLAVMLGVNAALLRASLRPLEGLATLMQRVDLLRPGERVSVTGNGDVAHLVTSFNEMLDRLESERGASTARTLAAMEGERQRIAQELHDEIGQGLTAVLLSLKRTVDHAPPEMAVELSSVQDITRACL